MKKSLLLLIAVFCWTTAAGAAEMMDSVTIFFKVNKSNLDPEFADNRKSLDRIADSLRTGYADSIYQLRRVHVIGGASPEGSVAVNKRLSEQRATTLFNYLQRYGQLPQDRLSTHYIGCDWDGLLELIKNDATMPYRESAQSVVQEIADANKTGDPGLNSCIARLKALHGGAVYRYINQHMFPELRASKLILTYEKIANPAVKVKTEYKHITDTVIVTDTIVREVFVQLPCEPKPWFAALKTNMLYDALLVPNIGVEVAFADVWSVAANWMYAWWKCDHKHNYWRTYGGDIEIRRWFGPQAEAKPLSGHHAGIYGQMLTYDVELGHSGYLGDRWTWAVGASYGYSLPVGRHLNIDFEIGIGYLQGTYQKYKPIDDHYVWQSTRKRHWVGPTKLEISLVWLFGNGNVNKMKGGEK